MALRADDGRRRPTSSTSRPASRGARPRARHVPARRAADRAGSARRGPLRGALIGAMLFEGLADTAEEAEATLAAGDGIDLEPCHHRGAVGPDGRRRQPVDVGLRAARRGARRHVVVLAQRGPRQGAALRRLRPRGDRPAALDDRRARPAAAAGRARAPGRSTSRRSSPRCCRWATRATTATAPASLMLLRELLPDDDHRRRARRPTSPRRCGSPAANEHFFLNLGMPACKLATRRRPRHPRLDAWSRRWRATAPTSASSVSGTGDEWFTGPANTPEGLFLGSYGPDDANPDIGDSAITETAGIGGFAMAAAPAIVRFVGGDVPFALRATQHDVRDHGRRAPGIPGADPRSSAARRPASTSRRWRAPASCRRSTPAWPAGWPAPARSAPGWSRPRSSASQERCVSWRHAPPREVQRLTAAAAGATP